MFGWIWLGFELGCSCNWIQGLFFRAQIRLASVETGPMEGVTRDVEDFEGCRFTVTRGDYSPLLRLVVAELRLASEHAANDTERHMLRHYIDSFCTGSLAVGPCVVTIGILSKRKTFLWRVGFLFFFQVTFSLFIFISMNFVWFNHFLNWEIVLKQRIACIRSSSDGNDKFHIFVFWFGVNFLFFSFALFIFSLPNI